MDEPASPPRGACPAEPRSTTEPSATGLARWLGPALALVFAISPAFFWKGTLLAEEVAGLLRKNWAPRSFLQKAFDPRGWDFYQGRELSYAIDYLDAQWVRWLMSHDRLLLVPPSGMLASLAFVAIGLWLVPRALPGLSRATRWLSLLLLLSNFAVQCSMGVLYRATKPLVAPLLLALLLVVLAEHRRPRLSPGMAFGVIFGLGLTISLLDRQGLFYLMVVALVLALAWLRTRRGLPLASAAVAAGLVWYAYFRVLGPSIIQRLNGYWPSMRFQRLRPERLLASEPWLTAVDVLGDWTSLLVGGLPKTVLALAAVAGLSLWAWRNRTSPGRVLLAGGIAIAAIAAQVTMVAMMVERHPPVAWLGHRLWYYPLPYQSVVAFGLLWALHAIAARRAGVLPRAVPLALAALVALNVLAWPETRERMNSDPPFTEQITNSELFERSYRAGAADPRLGGSDRLFFYDCLGRFPRLAARAGVQVGEGEGFARSGERAGRLAALGHAEAHLTAWARPAGRYVLAGAARLRSGEKLAVLVRAGRPRLVAEIPDSAPTDGLERFRIEAELAEGANDIQLVSSLPEVAVDGAPRGTRAAYELQLPVVLWPASAVTGDASVPRTRGRPGWTPAPDGR